MIKMFIAAIMCLLSIAGCTSYLRQPCLAPGQRGRVSVIQPPSGENRNTFITVNTGRDTRVCVTDASIPPDLIRGGDVISGYQDETNDYRPGTWARVR